MFTDAIAKFEKGVRHLGTIAEGFGKDVRSVCEDFGEAFAELRGARASEPTPRRRAPRPRVVPAPSREVSELDQLRAERELKKRGFVVGEE